MSAADLELDASSLRELYKWIDTIPLSRPKKNISRDFSDGILMSEVIHHFVPNLVELHNYSPTNSVQQKEYNWNTLNQKCFRRLGFSIDEGDLKMITNSQRGMIERILILTRDKIALYQEARAARGRMSPGFRQITRAPPRDQRDKRSTIPSRRTGAASPGFNARASHKKQSSSALSPPPQQRRSSSRLGQNNNSNQNSNNSPPPPRAKSRTSNNPNNPPPSESDPNWSPPRSKSQVFNAA